MRSATVVSLLLAACFQGQSKAQNARDLLIGIDADNDGHVARHEFIQMLSIGKEPGSDEAQLRRRQLSISDIDKLFGGDPNKTFNFFDKNKDGFLNQTELEGALIQMGLSRPNAKLVAKEALRCDKGPCNKKLTKLELSSMAKGDPHFATWYGSTFSYHGACDLALIHNPAIGDGQGLDLHVRTAHMSDQAFSFISNAALRIGEDILEVLASGEYFINSHRGVPLPSRIGGFPVTKTMAETCHFLEGSTKGCAYAQQYTVNLSEEDRIIIKVASDMVHVDVEGTSEVFYGSSGLMGTYPASAMYHGKIARDGETFIQDAEAYAQEWQVRDTEAKLFQGKRFPQHPEKCIPAVKSTERGLRRLESDNYSRVAAEKACASVPGPEQEFCVLDVMATGDFGMAATVYGAEMTDTETKPSSLA